MEKSLLWDVIFVSLVYFCVTLVSDLMVHLSLIWWWYRWWRKVFPEMLFLSVWSIFVWHIYVSLYFREFDDIEGGEITPSPGDAIAKRMLNMQAKVQLTSEPLNGRSKWEMLSLFVYLFCFVFFVIGGGRSAIHHHIEYLTSWLLDRACS